MEPKAKHDEKPKEMGTASEAGRVQLDNRKNSTEAIYSSSDEDCDLGDNEKLFSEKQIHPAVSY